MCCRSNIFTNKQFLEFEKLFFIHEVAVNKRILTQYQIIIIRDDLIIITPTGTTRLLKCLKDI